LALKLHTKYFGEVEFSESDVISFPVGLFGFENEQSFLMLPFADSANSMVCLQSTQTPALAFVMIDPFSLQSDYTPTLQTAELKLLGVKSAGDLCFYALCALKNPVSDSTVNLKCPVVLNPKTQESRQIIMETDRYEMRHPLAQFCSSKEASPSC
jgi:flagellar assembly factor FliW